MLSIHLLLILIALGCFAAAALGIGGRINLVVGGLFCWLLASTVAG